MTIAPSTADIAAIRADLLKFARLQLRDDAQAEDVVQESLAAAFSGVQTFAGRASAKTWVFGILKHKIIDVLRARQRTVNVSSLTAEAASLDEAFDAVFQANAHWHPDARPANWGDPEAALEQSQFWEVFDVCLHHLPENTARVFMMREFLEFETAHVCTELGLTTSNCHVILHRARHALRSCLEKGWFMSGDAA
jgi:RNA polymerase sigma-70 factor, ECF subfamily